MDRIPASALIRATLLAALAGGLALTAFQFVVGEPIVDRAITREAAKHPDDDHGQQVFSRTQQKAGLVAAGMTYALALGLVFGGAFALIGHRLPGRTMRRRVAALAALGFWVLFLAPFLKYPANPPGVGDPGTVYQRQVMYVLFVALTAAGVGMALLRGRALRSIGMRSSLATAATVGVYGLYFGLILLLTPDNPDRNDAPRSLVWQFRAASITGSTLFWVVFGLVFAHFATVADDGRREAPAAPWLDPHPRADTW